MLMVNSKYNAEFLSSVKYCFECKTTKILQEFDVNLNGQFGKYPSCKSCRAIKRKLINNESINNGYKICIKCKEEKDVIEFDKDKSQKDGRQIYCKNCRRQISKNWTSTLDGFIKKILCDLNHYCKKNKIFINLTAEEIKNMYYIQDSRCAITGIPLTFISYSKIGNNNISEFFNLSIDRLDSLKDYSIGNIQLIGSMIKKMKGKMPNDKFIEFCKMVLY
jgi:hypothetical protein